MALGQELKDFVSGARAGYEMASNRRDKNREYERAILNDEVDNEFKKASTEKLLLGNKWYDRITESELADRSSAIAARNKNLQWADRLNQSLIDARSVDAFKTMYGGTTKPREMLDEEVGPDGEPTDYYNSMEDVDSSYAPANFSAIPIPAARRRQYVAEGGLIMDEEEERSALPIEAPVPPARPAAPAPAEPKDDVNPRVVGFDKAHEAVMEGINYTLNEMGLSSGAAVQDPDRAAKIANYLKGAGAAPKSLIDQAYQIVDPENELSESERTMGALGTVYNHYIRKGDPEKAKKAAASIVQYQRRLFQTYASIAQAAAENGDIDNTVEAAIRAYSSVPDGRDLKVTKTEDGRYAVQITDEATGAVIDKPVLTPQEIGAWALKVNPASFDEYIANASGDRKPPSQRFQELAGGLDTGAVPTNEDMASLELEEQRELRQRAKDMAEEGAGGAKAATYEQINSTRTNLQDVLGQMEAAPGDEEGSLYYPGLAELAPSVKKTMVDAATDLMSNPRNRGDVNLSEQDALEFTGAIVAAGPDAYKKKPEKGGMRITLPDDREAWMPMARFKQLDNIYKAKRTKEAGRARVDKARANRDAASAEQDMEETRARVGQNREEVLRGDPWANPLYSGSALPLEVDSGGQAALDRLNELLGQ